jgi:serine/threonine-protein kinase
VLRRSDDGAGAARDHIRAPGWAGSPEQSREMVGHGADILWAVTPVASSMPIAVRGERLGDYQVLAKLATGGMAEIYLARPLADGRGEPVVLKRILPHLAEDPRFIEMFRDEASLASRLDHDNVCRVLSPGEVGGAEFLVMEYLHGISLGHALGRWARTGQPLDISLVAGIAVQACAGLHHAHELRGSDGQLLNVVHRDVSPPNIFITADGVVKLLDFGIAKARGASSKTRTGTIKGKNAYMSPEQVLGQPLDRRSDIFALGTVLFELLTLRRLFRQDTDFLTFKAITEQPIPSVAERRPDTPPALQEAVHRALERDRTRRYATAQEFAAAVAAAVAPLGGTASAAALAERVNSDFAAELREKRSLFFRVTGPVPAPLDGGAGGAESVGAISDPEISIAPELARDRAGEIRMSAPRPSDLGPLPVPSVEISQSALAQPPTLVTAMTQTEALALPGRRLGPLSAALLFCSMAAAGFVLGAWWWTGRTAGNPAALPGANAPGRLAAADEGAAPALAATLPSALPEEPVAAPRRSAPASEAHQRPSRRRDEGSERRRRSGDRALASREPAGEERPDEPERTGAPGFFSIDSSPYATIYVDGKKLGVTPLFRVALDPGSHRVKAVNASGDSQRFRVQIRSGKETSSGRLRW